MPDDKINPNRPKKKPEELSGFNEWLPPSLAAIAPENRKGVVKVSDVVAAIYAASLRGALATTAKIYRTRIRDLEETIAIATGAKIGTAVARGLGKQIVDKAAKLFFFLKTKEAETELEKGLKDAFAGSMKRLTKHRLNPTRRKSKMPMGFTSSRE